MINEKNMNETISTVIKAAETIIENMEVGSRYTNQEFVGQIVGETQVPVAIASGMTALIVSNCDMVKQRAGRGGGIFRIDPKNIDKKSSSTYEYSKDSSDEEGDSNEAN